MVSKRRMEIHETADGYYISQYPAQTRCSTIADVALDTVRRLTEWKDADAAPPGSKPTDTEVMLLDALKEIKGRANPGGGIEHVAYAAITKADEMARKD